MQHAFPRKEKIHASTPVRQYASTPVRQYASTPVRQRVPCASTRHALAVGARPFAALG